MADHEAYPCPVCGERDLVYDGALVWRSGSRPPREWARTDLDFLSLPRADYERECHYHCAGCGALFFEDVDSSFVHLYGDEGRVCYLFNAVRDTWEYRFLDPANGQWRVMSYDRQARAWTSRPHDDEWQSEILMGLHWRRPPMWRLYYKQEET